MRSFTATGDNGFIYTEINSTNGGVGQMTQRVQVAADTPYLIATIVDPITGYAPLTDNVQMNITGPDNTVYNQQANTPTLLAVNEVNGLVALCVVNPGPGLWTLSVRCTVEANYRASIQLTPAADGLGNIIRAMLPYYPGDTNVDADTLIYQTFKWAFWSASALIFQGLARQPMMNLAKLFENVLSLDSARAAAVLALVQPQATLGILTTFAQATNNANSDVDRQLIVNGDANDGLSNWNIISGTGEWHVESGYSASIQYPNCFAVLTSMCKASQTVYLLHAGGFNAAYLDTSPTITISEWIAVRYDQGVPDTSTYYLNVELRDANQNVVKQFQTGAVIIASTVDAANQLRWYKVTCVFDEYGPGVRSVYFEHGGQNPPGTLHAYGIMMTGATVEVELAHAANEPPNLIKNGSGQNGIVDWTIIGPNPWLVETGPGAQCPRSLGNTDFGINTGWGKKSQVIDLVAAGYDTAYLDLSPAIQLADWICSYPDCTCNYYMNVELRDANNQPLATYASGIITIPPSPGNFVPFVWQVHNMTDYPVGVRYIYFEHGGSHMEGAHVAYAAKITGTSVKLAERPPGKTIIGPHGNMSEMRRDVAAQGTRVTDTTPTPFRWICFLEMTLVNGQQMIASGWLTRKAASDPFVVMTAAHALYDKGGGWVKKITVSPAYGNAGGAPYAPIDATGHQLQLPIDYLGKNQASVTYDNSYDYAAIVIPQASWDTGGFTLTVEDDQHLYNQPGTVTAFPANEPYPNNWMYTQDATLNSYNNSLVIVPTDFGGGASGGPVYVKGTSNAVGVFSFLDSLAGYLVKHYAARVTNKVVERATNWAKPLTPNDLVTKFQIVIHTGDAIGAGTDDDLKINLMQQTLDLDKYWVEGNSSRFRSRNERNDFDVYDLSQALLPFVPYGKLYVSNLVGRIYTITRDPSVIAYHTWANGEWLVGSVAFYANDQLLCADTFNKWVPRPAYPSPVTGTIRLA